MKNSTRQTILAVALLAVAGALMVVGSGRSYEVIRVEEQSQKGPELPPDVPFPPEPWMPPEPMPSIPPEETVESVGDLQMIVETTRTGVRRDEDKLYFTGNQQCTT